MRFAQYYDRNGASQMIGKETAAEVLASLGRTFKEGLDDIGKEAEKGTSDLWAGLAAYTLLKLQGENARLDASYKLIMKIVTDAAFEMAQAEARRTA